MFQDPDMRQSIEFCEEVRFEDESGLLVDQKVSTSIYKHVDVHCNCTPDTPSLMFLMTSPYCTLDLPSYDILFIFLVFVKSL